MQIILASSLKNDPATEQHLELYQLLRDHSRCKVTLLENALITDIVSRAGSCYFTKSLNNITDSIIIACEYNQLSGIDPSNKIIYLTAQSQLADPDLSVIGRCEYVGAQSDYAATIIGQQVVKYGLQTPVTRLRPWFRVDKYPFRGDGTVLIHTTNSDTALIRAVGSPTIEYNGELENAKVLFCLGPTPLQLVYKAMLQGVLVVALDMRPYNEIIIDNYNGFLVDGVDRLAQVMRNLEATRFQIVGRARSMVVSGLNNQQYTSKLFSLIEGRAENYNPAPIILKNERKWVVRGREFKNGKVNYYPHNINPQFSVTNVHDPIEILEYFSGQLFSEVYVFGCEFGEYDATDMQRMRVLLGKLGERARRIRFCLETIPKGYEEFFRRLGVVPLSEGLKQVR